MANRIVDDDTSSSSTEVIEEDVNERVLNIAVNTIWTIEKRLRKYTKVYINLGLVVSGMLAAIIVGQLFILYAIYNKL